jgi:hypothetical protein
MPYPVFSQYQQHYPPQQAQQPQQSQQYPPIQSQQYPPAQQQTQKKKDTRLAQFLVECMVVGTLKVLSSVFASSIF